MDSETAINTADVILREIPNVKTTTKNVIPHKIVKEELQTLKLGENMQEKILETLKYIHGANFRLNTSSDYEEKNSSILKKYWTEQGSLVVKGGHDFSTNNPETEESERLRQFGLLRLESYGFHKNHCIEAYSHCNGDIEDSLYLLYHKYFPRDEVFETDELVTTNELKEMRREEISSLESIYGNIFKTKLDNVWIVTLKLDYLVRIFHKKEEKETTNVKVQQKKEKCRNLIRGHCKYGDKCRFSHELDIPKKQENKHLNDFTFELEIRLPNNSKYPHEPPLIFLKTDAIVPPLARLHICKKLFEEANMLAKDGMPCLYTIIELIQNEQTMREHLKEDYNFLSPNQKLFPVENSYNGGSSLNPSHYKKGRTNRDNKRIQTDSEVLKNDQIIVYLYKSRMKEGDYIDILEARKCLPAWNMRNDILNSLNQSQIVVISGETGCGKSTQVPQFIFDDWIKNYDNDKRHIEIICTQPRRISALGVAERVSAERLEKVGNTVGYQIRLESKMSAKTRISFCTTGILLRRLEGEPTLSGVTHVIIDEVHERSEESDFLLLILKELIQIRPDLKVILMSATMNASLFSDYFGGIPVVEIPGRTYPVEQIFLEDIMDRTDYVLEEGSEFCRNLKKTEKSIEEIIASCEINPENAPRNNIKDENLTLPQLMARYRDYSSRICRNLYFTDVDKINNELIETTLEWIISGDHAYPRTGTILIFLPGFAEITALYDQLKIHPIIGVRGDKFLLLPLHSSLTNEEQAAIFRKPKGNQRKIVISTNLAETSITIDDCVFVIDSGKMKEKRFDPNRNMESLETTWVTKANALQRKGRAGRVMPGVCFHLYTKPRFQYNLLPQPISEIHRIPLEQLILNIKVLPSFDGKSAKDVLGSFIEPPSIENITTAIKRLENVGALGKKRRFNTPWSSFGSSTC